jgi:hypothetical protein
VSVLCFSSPSCYGCLVYQGSPQEHDPTPFPPLRPWKDKNTHILYTGDTL